MWQSSLVFHMIPLAHRNIKDTIGKSIKNYGIDIEIDPFDPIAHQVLGRMALSDGRAALATRELTVALALDPVDRVAAHTDLAESLLLSEKFDEAKSQVMAALEIAPSYERAQELLLTIIESEP